MSMTRRAFLQSTTALAALPLAAVVMAERHRWELDRDVRADCGITGIEAVERDIIVCGPKSYALIQQEWRRLGVA